MKGKVFIFNGKKVPKKNFENFLMNSTKNNEYKIILTLKDGSFDEEIFRYPIRQRRRMTEIYDKYPELFIVRAKSDIRMTRIAERNRKKKTIYFRKEYFNISGIKSIGPAEKNGYLFVEIKFVNQPDAVERALDNEGRDKRIDELIDRIGKDKVIYFAGLYILKDKIEVIFKQWCQDNKVGLFLKLSDASDISEIFDNHVVLGPRYDEILSYIHPDDRIHFNGCDVIKDRILSFAFSEAGFGRWVILKFSGDYKLHENLETDDLAKKRLNEIFESIDKPYI